MSQKTRGRLPLAVVLLEFSDVEGGHDEDRFRRQFTAAGRGTGNLLDYWHDMSYGLIDLTDSELFGPWRMRYSLAHDAADPLRNGAAPRNAWCQEARRLLQEHHIDLRRFHAVVAVVNAHVDGSSNGLDFAGSWEGRWGEPDWRFCRSCSALCRSDAGAASGHCPVIGAAHDYSSSYPYVLATDHGFPGQPHWRTCSRCAQLVHAPDPTHPPGSCPAGSSHVVETAREFRIRSSAIPWGDQSGWKYCSRCASLIFMGDAPLTVTGCAAGGDHDFSASGTYGIHVPLQFFSIYFAAHESGHGFNLGHAGRRGEDDGYANWWDVMGYGHQFSGSYEGAGPGLTAPHRLMLSVIPTQRVRIIETLSGLNERVTLGPLDSLGGARPVAVEVATRAGVYTVELRRRSGWDQGIPREAAVLIHELGSSYLAVQQNWRYCGRCHTMAFAGRLACAGGGIHDVSGSGSYLLKTEGHTGAVGQPGWRWCGKCQGLIFAPDDTSPEPCPYGGTHNVSFSWRYVVAGESDAGAAGQRRWRYCFRCGALAYNRGGGRSACAAGGVHDFSFSGPYVVLREAHDPSAQSGWRWCAKCQQLVFMGAGIGSGYCAGIPDASLGHDFTPSRDYGMAPNRAPYDGQSGWEWCVKCNGILFAGTHGRCAAGGDHGFLFNGGYRIPLAPTTSGGQSGWRYCRLCGGLVFPSDHDLGPCSGGAQHDLSASGDYVAADAGVVKIVPFDRLRDDWRIGDTFEDAARHLAIEIEAVTPLEATIAIRSLG